MKKQVVLFIGLSLFALQTNAQKITDVPNPAIISSGTHFSEAISHTKWSNANGKSFTKAKYSTYSGESFIKLEATEDVDAIIKFNVKIDKGELLILVLDAGNNILFEKSFVKSEAEETEIALKSDEKYQVKFIGDKTKGSYFCQWIQKP